MQVDASFPFPWYRPSFFASEVKNVRRDVHGLNDN
jgi:hypothetical protein